MAGIFDNVSAELKQEIVNNYVKVYPIPIDEISGEPLYTSRDWTKLCIKNNILKVMYRANQIDNDATIDISEFEEGIN